MSKRNMYLRIGRFVSRTITQNVAEDDGVSWRLRCLIGESGDSSERGCCASDSKENILPLCHVGRRSISVHNFGFDYAIDEQTQFP